MAEYVCELPVEGMVSFMSGTTTIPVHERIVRCRDCEHYSEHKWIIATDVSDVCHFWHGEPTKVKPDGFCAWGKLKEEK